MAKARRPERGKISKLVEFPPALFYAEREIALKEARLLSAMSVIKGERSVKCHFLKQLFSLSLILLFAGAGARAQELSADSAPEEALADKATALVYADNPERLISDLLSQAIEFNRRPETTNKEKYDFYQNLSARYVDLKNAGLFVLGGHAAKMSDEEKNRFVSLFSDFLTLNLVSRISKYTDESLFQMLRAVKRREGYYVIVYKYIDPDIGSLEISWVAIKAKGSDSYKIFDVHINGLSLIMSRRQEYSSFIRRKGLEALVEELAVLVEKQKAALFKEDP